MLADAPRAQLIHIETDRRLGHEWDEWDGKPLPGNGDFSARPGLFFRLGALTLVVAVGAAAALVFLLAPRLESLHPSVPTLLWAAPARCGGGRWRARHDDRLARRRRQAAGPRAHHAPPQRTVPGCGRGSRRHGAVGEELGVPNRFLSAATSRSAIACPAWSSGTITSRSRSEREGS